MKPEYHYEIIQGSDQWFDIRTGKMTGSHAQCIQAKPTTKGKSVGKREGLDTYCCEIVKEILFGRSEVYFNDDMQRGVDLEDDACVAYALETGVYVEKCGFVSLGKYVGISPDGLVGEIGGVEIKNHDEKTFLKLINSEEIDPKYIAQVEMNLYVTKREWWDYVGYNANFSKPFIKRFYLNDETIKRFDDGLDYGRNYIEKALQIAKEYY